jgi:hypothetical protein
MEVAVAFQVHQAAFPQSLNLAVSLRRSQLFNPHPVARQEIPQEIRQYQTGIVRVLLQAVVEVKVREEIQKCKGRIPVSIAVI